MNAPADVLETRMQEVLKVLAKCDSAHSMPFSEIKKRLPIIQSEILDLMVETRQIMTVRITRNDITENHYWPNPHGSKAIELPKHKSKIPPPRRSENLDIPIFTTLSNPLLEKAVMPDEIKPITLQLLEYIETHPGCSKQDLKPIFHNPMAYLGGPLKRGEILMAGNGTLSMKSGCKAVEIYHTSGVQKKIKIEQIEIETKPQPTPEQSKPTIEEFIASYSSDCTLTIYGVASEPMHLSSDQLNQLLNFLDRCNVIMKL